MKKFQIVLGKLVEKEKQRIKLVVKRVNMKPLPWINDWLRHI